MALDGCPITLNINRIQHAFGGGEEEEVIAISIEAMRDTSIWIFGFFKKLISMFKREPRRALEPYGVTRHLLRMEGEPDDQILQVLQSKLKKGQTLHLYLSLDKKRLGMKFEKNERAGCILQ